jgi:geranylgeranyl diphosphate synthase type II
MLHSTSLSDLLKPFQQEVEKNISDYIHQLGKQTLLHEACCYALSNGGKRFRPAIVRMVAKALDSQVDVSLAALSIELFHTASLIADDLPCMDNEEMRRNQLTTHKKYGEGTALLATYALIAAGYECLIKNAQIIKQSSLSFAKQADEICLLTIENVTANTGIQGATGGQFLDIHPTNLSLAIVLEVIRKKTVTLFEISFVTGWLFGGGDPKQIPVVKQLAEHFGVAFQIADDLADRVQDAQQHSINIVNLFGYEQAISMLTESKKAYRTIINQLNIASEELFSFINLCE